MIIALIAATFSVWIYAFSGAARRDPPDLLDQPAFAAAAEEVCAAAYAELDEMPGALDATNGPDRSRQVLASTDRLGVMVDELEALATGSERDQQIIGAWLEDWRTLLGDRYRYADAVADDPAAMYVITDTGINELLDRRITRLANTNAMPSCTAPGDLG